MWYMGWNISDRVWNICAQEDCNVSRIVELTTARSLLVREGVIEIGAVGCAASDEVKICNRRANLLDGAGRLSAGHAKACYLSWCCSMCFPVFVNFIFCDNGGFHVYSSWWRKTLLPEPKTHELYCSLVYDGLLLILLLLFYTLLQL